MGFFVLLALLAYILLARFTARAVERRFGKRAKYITIAVFVLIPTWDIVPGWMYFEHRCVTDAGQKIYKTVKLQKQYFLVAGEPDPSRPMPGKPDQVVRASGGEVNRVKLREQYQIGEERYTEPFHVTKVHHFIKDKKTDEILGSATRFERSGGWGAALFREQAGWPRRCPPEHFDPYEPTIYDALPQKIFQPLSGD